MQITFETRKRNTELYVLSQGVPEGRPREGLASWIWHVDAIPGVSVVGLVTNEGLCQVVWGIITERGGVWKMSMSLVNLNKEDGVWKMNNGAAHQLPLSRLKTSRQRNGGEIKQGRSKENSGKFSVGIAATISISHEHLRVGNPCTRADPQLVDEQRRNKVIYWVVQVYVARVQRRPFKTDLEGTDR